MQGQRISRSRTDQELWSQTKICKSSVQFSRSVVSGSLWPHGLQHFRPPCPSPSPRDYSCPSCQWCHPTISSSMIPFFSHLQSFPASGSFPMSWFFASGGQSIEPKSISRWGLDRSPWSNTEPTELHSLHSFLGDHWSIIKAWGKWRLVGRHLPALAFGQEHKAREIDLRA